MYFRKIICTIFTIAVVVMLASCGGTFRGNVTEGEGPLIYRTFQTDDFFAIDLAGFFAVSFTQSDEFAVTIVMQENLLDQHEVVVRNGSLTITDNIRGGVSFGYTPRLYLYAPYLTHITLGGGVIAMDWDEIRTDVLDISTSGFASLNIPLNVDVLTINASGSSILQLQGRATAVTAVISGFVEVQALELQAANVTINGSGSAEMEIAVSDALDVDLSGFSLVRHSGNPIVTSRFGERGRLEQVQGSGYED